MRTWLSSRPLACGVRAVKRSVDVCTGIPTKLWWEAATQINQMSPTRSLGAAAVGEFFAARGMAADRTRECGCCY